MGLIHTENRAGKPIQIAGYQFVPIEKSSRMQPPGKWGVLFWRRPSAVVVQHPDGTDEVIEIQDQTRKAQAILLGIGLVGSFLILYMSKCINLGRQTH
jgi:amino acid transporter